MDIRVVEWVPRVHHELPKARTAEWHFGLVRGVRTFVYYKSTTGARTFALCRVPPHATDTFPLSDAQWIGYSASEEGIREVAEMQFSDLELLALTAPALDEKEMP